MPYFNEKVKAGNDSNLTVGSNALIKPIKNSNNNGIGVGKAIEALEKAESQKTGIFEAQLGLGEAYISLEGNPAYKVVAQKAWERALQHHSLEGMSIKEFWNEVAEDLRNAGNEKLKDDDPGERPVHRTERLLKIIEVNGKNWSEMP